MNICYRQDFYVIDFVQSSFSALHWTDEVIHIHKHERNI